MTFNNEQCLVLLPITLFVCKVAYDCANFRLDDTRACAYACVCVCVWVCARVCVYVFARACMCVPVRVCVCVWREGGRRLSFCLSLSMGDNTQISMYVCTYHPPPPLSLYDRVYDILM